MAELLVGALLSASFDVLFDRLASGELISFFSKQKFDDGLLHKLKLNLMALQAVLDDAEDKQITNKHVKDWLDELQHVVYQADDLLDEIATMALRNKLEADDNQPQTQSSTSKIRLSRFFHLMKQFLLRINCFVSTPAYLSDKAIESKMKEVIIKLEEIVNQKNSLHLIENWRRRETSPLSIKREETSLVNESEIYGRNNDKEKIMKLLLSDNATRNQIPVIPIVGMGGMGKTTLAQLVYNDAQVQEKFHVKAWVYVSDAFDSYKITKKILDDVTGANNSIDSLDQLQIKLKESLAGKKFLIVLDDVWNNNSNDWEHLSKPFINGAHESRIIVTTRNDEVALAMRAVPSLHLNQLSFEDSWSLFTRHAFGSNNYMAPSNLQSIGKQIVEKCKGLPLAVKSLGGLLRSKPNSEDWKNILKSKIWGLKERNILPALRLSYQYLSLHLKRCFAYCSIFSKDYKFEKEKLIQLWIAVDLVQQQPNMLLEDVGKDYFHELLSMSFFQRLINNTDSGFAMHDLIHDLAKQINGEFGFRLEDGKPLNHNLEKVRHFSYVQGEYNASEKFKDVNEVKCLRTFISFSRDNRSSFLGNKVLVDMLPSLKCLRVLSLSQYHIFELPKSIENLIHLRYLDLSWTKIRRLPDSVTTLSNIQALDLSFCENLIELPLNMGKLINLRHLDIRKTRLTEMPTQMSRLKDLQHLTYFVVGKNGGSRISGLKELCQLRGQLSILGLENVTIGRDASEANLKGKEHLEGLELEWSGDTNDSEKERDVLDRLQAHVGVKDLCITNYGGTRFPDWLERAHSLCDMVSLDLIDCANCSFLPSLGQLPSLKHLRIEGMKAITKVGQEFYWNASSSIKPFQYLETLSFKGMSEWEEWHASGVGEFSRLLEFSMVDCPKLTGELSICLPSLRKLEISKCQRLVSNQVGLLLRVLPSAQELKISVMTNLTELPQQLQHLYSLKKFEISDIPNLKELPQQLQHMSSLQNLEISDIPNLKELPQELCRLVNLERLKIEQCPRLVSFPDIGLLPMLKTLEIERCEALRSLAAVPSEDIMNVMRINNCLEVLRIYDCSSLLQVSLPIAALKTLAISDCGKLELETEEHNYYTSIEDLSLIESCDLLKSLSLGFFPKLRSLNILCCKNLETLLIPDELQNLTYLCIGDCENLKSLPQGMHTHLPSLESLTIEKCPEVESFPDGGLPSNLTTLVIYKCEKLMKGRMGWDLHTLPSLGTFSISGEYKEQVLESFPEECLLPTTLTSLTIVNLQNLKSLNYKGVQHLTSLKTLSISYCPKLQSLPCHKRGCPTPSLTCIYDIVHC